MDSARAAQPHLARPYGIVAGTRRPVARDYGLIWLLTLLGTLGLLFWFAVIAGLVALL